MPSIRRLSLLALALCCAPLFAHDFWIEPASFRPHAGAPFAIELKVGDFAVGDSVARNDSRTVDFTLHGPDGVKPVVGRDGATPAGFVRVESEGLYVLGYRSHPTAVELDAAKFEGYLREKGLDSVAAERARLGESTQPARERYSRCAKSIVRVGTHGSQEFDAMLGYPLEIAPELNPCDLFAAGATPARLPVRVFFDGAPLANALVAALDLDAPARPESGAHAEPILARTDSQGRASLPLPRSGRWLLAVVHMQRAANRAEADWESYWASLTFETTR